eukprot:COSAG05_NODE_5220_length_1233_cov_1.419753_1_plen_53_part_10
MWEARGNTRDGWDQLRLHDLDGPVPLLRAESVISTLECPMYMHGASSIDHMGE